MKWKTRSGKEVEISEMLDNHLNNTINLIDGKLRQYFEREKNKCHGFEDESCLFSRIENSYEYRCLQEMLKERERRLKCVIF